jgi:hypothetical protein
VAVYRTPVLACWLPVVPKVKPPNEDSFLSSVKAVKAELDRVYLTERAKRERREAE